MDIEELAGFLREKLGVGSKIASVGTDIRPHLEIETQQELKQDILVGLIREFYRQKGLRVTNSVAGLNVNEDSITISASEIAQLSKPPPFHSFVTVN